MHIQSAVLVVLNQTAVLKRLTEHASVVPHVLMLVNRVAKDVAIVLQNKSKIYFRVTKGFAGNNFVLTCT